MAYIMPSGSGTRWCHRVPEVERDGPRWLGYTFLGSGTSHRRGGGASSVDGSLASRDDSADDYVLVVGNDCSEN